MCGPPQDTQNAFEGQARAWGVAPGYQVKKNHERQEAVNSGTGKGLRMAVHPRQAMNSTQVTMQTKQGLSKRQEAGIEVYQRSLATTVK